MAGTAVQGMAVLRLALVAAVGLALAGCEDGKLAFGADSAGTASTGQTTELVQTDVEAPEVFQVTGSGLWDGRPSLGGVWIAHPDVTDPERVIIRNQDNGTFVIGALFRRERDNPGPALQVSSDAAEALQMLAGAPATLNVTALRREEPPAPDPAVAPVDGAATLDAASPIAATGLDPVQGAAAAIGAAEAAGAPGTITSAPLDPAPLGAAQAPLVADADAAAASQSPPATTSDLNRPYIQLGIFSVEANADALVADMATKGITAKVVAQESQGSNFWRVLAGPAANEAARATLLEQVKAEGFADAYFVDN